MTKIKQTYKYKIAGSILGDTSDEYKLSENEFFRIYSFYVTYSMCGSLSAKKRSFTDYGWPNNSLKDEELKSALREVISLNRNPNFIFTEENDLGKRFSSLKLDDGEIKNLDFERAVIARTAGTNYIKLFHRIRNGLAHGKFKLRYSTVGEKMVVIQDDNGYNVTARIVIKLNTLLDFIKVIDLNGLI